MKSSIIAIALATVAQAISLPQLHRRDAQSPLIKWQFLAEDCMTTDNRAPCQCQANRVVAQLRCDGTNCDDVYLGCAQMFDDQNDGNYVTVGDIINAREISDTFPPTYCPPNTAATKWTCTDKFCDLNTMGCQAFEKRFTDGRVAAVTFPEVSDPACTWTGWVNSGNNPQATQCPAGQFLRGLEAKGRHSDSLRMFCCPPSLGQSPLVLQQQLNAVQCTTGSDGKCLSKWKCMQGTTEVTTMDIWWGHTSGDAAWACNSWNSQCGNAAGGCTATAIASNTTTSTTDNSNTNTNNNNNQQSSQSSTTSQTTTTTGDVQCANGSDGKCYSKWKCMLGSKDMGDLDIWWGHTSGDAVWACNNWNSQCGNTAGGCTAKFVSANPDGKDYGNPPPYDECEI